MQSIVEQLHTDKVPSKNPSNTNHQYGTHLSFSHWYIQSWHVGIRFSIFVFDSVVVWVQLDSSAPFMQSWSPSSRNKPDLISPYQERFEKCPSYRISRCYKCIDHRRTQTSTVHCGSLTFVFNKFTHFARLKSLLNIPFLLVAGFFVATVAAVIVTVTHPRLGHALRARFAREIVRLARGDCVWLAILFV